MPYAERTNVSVEESRMQIERLLARRGADSFGYMSSPDAALVAFRLEGRHFKIGVPLPDRNNPEFTEYQRGTVTKTTYRRSTDEAYKRWEQASRQRWRALLLLLKAQLEAVELGLLSLDEALLPFAMLPDGQSVGEWMRPQLDEVYARKQMPTRIAFALPAGE